MHFKKHTEVCPASSSHSITIGKLIHLSYFLFFFSAGMLEEKEEAMQKDRERIQELEQTLFELHGDIGAGRHVHYHKIVLMTAEY
jgi:hypothetical protein